MSGPRVRFAPSPTGYLHVGGARTALFNWLYARRYGGTFVVRVEDTDLDRSTDESLETILRSLRWLGLDWDEGPGVGGDYGPYRQTERRELYKSHADRLVEEGKAYRCYATREELAALREEAQKAGKKFFYPHIWREKTSKDWPSDKSYVIRFKTPLDGATAFDDAVFGNIRTPHNTIQDFVIMRSNGDVPLYNFGAVVDDVCMKITLVARGRDHIINTPQQILLYQALGYEVPTFAHLPMMLAPNGKKLSKRDGDKYDIPVDVAAYKERGFSPDALLNYLVRFGWSHGDQELFRRSEMIELFDFNQVSKPDGKFDMKKCDNINYMQLKNAEYTSRENYLVGLRPQLEKREIVPTSEADLASALDHVVERSHTYAEAAYNLEYFFKDDFEFDAKAKRKFLSAKFVANLELFAKAMSGVEDFSAEGLEQATAAFLEANELGMKAFAQAARVALTGRKASPGLYEVMATLGRERSLSRLNKGVELAKAAAEG